MKRFLTAALLLSGSVLSAADLVTGSWKIEGDVSGTSFSEACTLKLTENKVSGTCTNPEKSYDVTGDVDGQKVTFTHAAEYNGDPLTLTYTGTLDESGAMKGSVDVQPMGVSGDFTATKDKAPEVKP